MKTCLELKLVTMGHPVYTNIGDEAYNLKKRRQPRILILRGQSQHSSVW